MQGEPHRACLPGSTAWGTDYPEVRPEGAGRAADRGLGGRDRPARPPSPLAGGPEQDWCRNDSPPFPQHSFVPEHREPEARVREDGAPPAVPLLPATSPSGAKGETLVGGVEGPVVSPLGSPMHVALSLPL